MCALYPKISSTSHISVCSFYNVRSLLVFQTPFSVQFFRGYATDGAFTR